MSLSEITFASLLVNAIPFVFFFAEIGQFYRTTKNRKSLKDLSLLNCALHVFGNGLYLTLTWVTGAWIGFCMSAFLVFNYIWASYWIIWNVRHHGLKLRDAFSVWKRLPCVIWVCSECGESNVAIRDEELGKCKKCGYEGQIFDKIC